MIAETEVSLRPMADRIRGKIPSFKVSVSNSYALRGRTPKGDYEMRVYLKHREVRTTFLRKGSNPLKGIKLLCRTSFLEGDKGLGEHVAAIQANEEKLPLIRKDIDPDNGDEFVTILPFGEVEKAPRVVVRKSARTGFVSVEVRDALEMSLVEAKAVGKAIRRAYKIAAAEKSQYPDVL